MNRKKAIDTIKEVFGEDRYGIRDTLTDEQAEAIRFALFALKHPERMCCGRCEAFGDEDVNGDGWCYRKDKFATCDDKPCGALTRREEDRD